MPCLVKVFAIVALLFPSTSVAECVAGSCGKQQDEFSLMQLKNVIKHGAERYPVKEASSEVSDEIEIEDKTTGELTPQVQDQVKEIPASTPWSTPSGNCGTWLARKRVFNKQTAVVKPSEELKGTEISWEDRLAVLCRAWLIYTESPEDLATAASPEAVTQRVVPESQWDRSFVGDLPDEMACPTKIAQEDVDNGDLTTADTCWPQFGTTEFLGERVGGILHILSYGSLMNSPAAGQVGESIPVVVYSNLVRSAVLLHPDPRLSPFGFSDKKHMEQEACRYTVDWKDPEHKMDFSQGPVHLMNGVIQSYDLSDPQALTAFRVREQGYDMVQVPVIRIPDLLGEEPLTPKMVWTLRQSLGEWKKKNRLATSAQGPNLLYAYDSMSNDEAKFGSGFNRLVADSTYLAGTTTQEDGTITQDTLSSYIHRELSEFSIGGINIFPHLEKPQ